jgi:hypothetical protein
MAFPAKDAAKRCTFIGTMVGNPQCFIFKFAYVAHEKSLCSVACRARNFEFQTLNPKSKGWFSSGTGKVVQFSVRDWDGDHNWTETDKEVPSSKRISDGLSKATQVTVVKEANIGNPKVSRTFVSRVKI